MVDENLTKLKDIDEGLRNDIKEWYGKAVESLVNQDYSKTYKYLRSIYYSVLPFEFKDKEYLEEVTKVLNEYLNNVGGKASNKSQLIKIYKRKAEFSEVVNEYFILIPQTLNNLGLWLKTLKNYDNLDTVFSEETFNSDADLLKFKKEKLLSIDKEELLNLFSSNNVNDAFSRYLIKYGNQ